MGSETVNKIKDSEIHGDFVGRDKIINITMFQESEREFVVTHNANIKPVSYFTGRETELQELSQRIEKGRKSVLVSGMGGIGKTHICRKLFEDYTNKHADGENIPFCHIGYIEYNGDMGSSLQKCLKFKEQDNPELNKAAAWKELEYLASSGKLLLFVDNVNVTIKEDTGLEKLKEIPGAVILTSRRTTFSKEFEPYRIGFLSIEQCKEVYGRIRYEGSNMNVSEDELSDLEYVIEKLAARHTITIEFLAHLARTKSWDVKELRSELEGKGFQLKYTDEEDKLINIQEEYEKLYDLSVLTEAEQNILEAFSVFPYIPLPAETCNQWLLADAGVNEDDDILMGLYRKGWLQFDFEQESYSMHPVFAQFIYEKCMPKIENHNGMIEVSIKYMPKNIFEYELALDDKKYLLFAASIVEKIDMGKNVEQACLFMNDVAYRLAYYMNKFEMASKIYKRAIKVAELGGNYESIVMANINLATMYKWQSEYKEAAEIYKKILRTCTSFDIYIGICACLANVYRRDKNYEESERLYKEILMIYKSDGDRLFLSAIYRNLGYTYLCKYEFEKTEENLEKSLKIDEEEQVYSLNMAETYSLLADICVELKKYEKAERLYERSLVIHEKVLPNSLDDEKYFDIAYVYFCQERYEEAEELYLKTLKKVIKTGKNRFTIIGYEKLAMLYEKTEKYELALCYDLKIYKILKDNNDSTINIYDDMKIVYSKCNPEGNFEQWLEEKMKE